MKIESSEEIISNSAAIVLKNSSILVFYLSQEGKFVYSNEKFLQEIGFTKAELFKRSIFELSPHLTSSVWMMMISSNYDINYTLTFALRTMNGKTLPMEATIQSVVISENRMICCLARDISNQKKLEELLSVQNTLLDSISRLNKIGTWEYNIQNSSLTWSHEMYSIHNVSTSYNPSFEKMLLFFTKETRTNLLFLFEQLMKGSIKNISIELPLISELGNEVWIMLNASAEKTPTNTIFKIYGTYQDVTDKVEDNLRFSELYDRYLRATRAARTGIFEYNLETEEMYWDKTMFSLYEIDEDTFSKSNKEWNSQTFVEDRSRIETCIFKAIDSKAQVNEEFRISTENTSIRWLRIIGEARYSQDGIPTHFIGVNIDISEQKKKDQELLDSKEFLQSIYSSVDQAIFVIEKQNDGRIVYIDSNPAHEKLSGIKREDLIGKSPNDISSVISESVSNVLLCKYKECFATNVVIEYEESLLENGKQSWWFTRLTPVQNENSEATRVIASSIDITKLKVSEQEIIEKNEVFKSIATLQQEFISSKFSNNSLHTILLDCLAKTSSTFGFVAELTDRRIQSDVSIQNLLVLTAIVRKSDGTFVQLFKDPYQISLQEVDLFRPSNLEKVVFNNDKNISFSNIGFPPSFPNVSSFVLKPLKQDNVLNGILLIGNGVNPYTVELFEKIEPITTTLETIFAGFKIMQKESFTNRIVKELLEATSKSVGTELFDTLTKSLCSILEVDCTCLIQKEGKRYQLISSHLRGKRYSFVISETLSNYITSFLESTENIEETKLPSIMHNEPFLQEFKFKHFLFNQILNSDGEVIGIICLFDRKVISFSETILTTLSVLSTRVSAEIARIKSESEKNQLRYFAQNTFALERRNILLTLYQRQNQSYSDTVKSVLRVAHSQLALQKATYILFDVQLKSYRNQFTYPESFTPLATQLNKYEGTLEYIFDQPIIILDSVHSHSKIMQLFKKILTHSGLEYPISILPISHDHQVFGCLIFERNLKNTWPQEDIDFMISLSSVLPYTLEYIERKKIEQALEESEELFSTAFYTNPDPSILFSKDSPYIIKELNVSAKEKYGRQIKEFEGEIPLETILPTFIYEKVNELITEVEKSKERSKQDVVTFQDSFHFNISITILKNSKQNLFLLTIQDLTEIKTFEIALKQSNDSLEQLFMLTPSPIIIVDNETKSVLNYNEAWKNEFIKFSEDSIIGLSINQLFLNLFGISNFFEEIVKNETNEYEKTIQAYTANKELKEYKLSISKMLLNLQQQSIIVATDITEEANVQIKLLKAKDSAIESVATYSDFFLSIGRTIRSNVEQLQDLFLYSSKNELSLEEKNVLSLQTKKTINQLKELYSYTFDLYQNIEGSNKQYSIDIIESSKEGASLKLQTSVLDSLESSIEKNGIDLVLKELLNEWNVVSKTNVISSITRFALKIQIIGDYLSNQELVNYAESLLDATETFDIKNIKALLIQFPSILSKL